MEEIYYYKKEGSNGGSKEQMNFVALQQDNTTFSRIVTLENILYKVFTLKIVFSFNVFK